MKSLLAVMLADFFISCHADIANYFSDLSILV